MNSTGFAPRWETLNFRLVSLLEMCMKELQLAQVLDAHQRLGKMLLVFQVFGIPQQEAKMEEADFSSISDAVADLRPALQAAGLTSALLSLERFNEVLNEGTRKDASVVFNGKQAASLYRHADHVQIKINDDLSTKLVLIMPAESKALYEPEQPLFGADVDIKFKRKARREISEAGKCLALQRFTACVFHLMRTVEVAIEAMRICLELPPTNKGQHKAWGAALQRFREEIERRDDLTYVHQWNSMADRKFFGEVYMSLVAIKDGCRDDTMHVESDYNKQEAEHLFAMVKGFMQKIACRFDEDGLPLA
jgi:hypothetical protein